MASWYLKYLTFTINSQEHCPNLEVLDLSSISSPRRDSIVVRIEELQQGCPCIRILRLANSDIVLAETSVKDQVCRRLYNFHVERQILPIVIFFRFMIIFIDFLQVCSPGFPKLEELSIAVDPKRCVVRKLIILIYAVRRCTLCIMFNLILILIIRDSVTLTWRE